MKPWAIRGFWWWYRSDLMGHSSGIIQFSFFQPFHYSHQFQNAYPEAMNQYDATTKGNTPMTQNTTFPSHLLLTEEGYWEQPSWSRDPDDERWIDTGWQVRAYQGRVCFRHKSRAEVVRWLKDQGYVDTGNGMHYQRRSLASTLGNKETKSKGPESGR
jgi:hypothetical protein